jgi:hypothetical protein
MLKSLIIDNAFDSVYAISGALKVVLTMMIGSNTDIIAGWVVAVCLMMILGCWEFSQNRTAFRRNAWLVLRSLGIAVLVLVAAIQIGSKSTSLDLKKIKDANGHGVRLRLGSELSKTLKADNWRLYAPKGSLSIDRVFLASAGVEQSFSVQKVMNKGGGLYMLKGDNLWLSSPSADTPQKDGRKYFLVKEAAWVRVVRALVNLVVIGGAIALFLRQFIPVCWPILKQLFSSRAVQICSILFVLLYGAHQWRFLSQNHAMQMVTSRDDDGYMMQRLIDAHDLGTMDPNRVTNNAYGAIGYYPYAMVPALLGNIGCPMSLEFLNFITRGLKIVFSLGMMLSAWLLASRHFTPRAAPWAAALLFTNYGFLAYSSYPFYPDVFMAMLSLLALVCVLELLDRWDDRAFIFAVIFASISVATKFLTFLLFPLVVFVGLWSVWRFKPYGKGLLRFFLERGIIATVLGLGVYFFCNPYLNYNQEWIAPNGKMAQGIYSTDSPNLVASNAATYQNWLGSCYSLVNDYSEAWMLCIVVIAALFGLLLGLLFRDVRSHPWFGKLAVLFGFSALFQLYLYKTLSLPAALDSRLLLPIYPLIHLAFVLCLFGIYHLVMARRSPAKSH